MFKELGSLPRQRAVVLVLMRLEDDTVRVNIIARKLNESEKRHAQDSAERDWHGCTTRISLSDMLPFGDSCPVGERALVGARMKAQAKARLDQISDA